MSDYTGLIEDLSALVHESWVAGQRAKGRTAAKSRHEGGSPDLMVSYAELAEVDRVDDRRIVCTVLLGAAAMPVGVLLGLLADLLHNPVVRAQFREVALVDPTPASLADRCQARLAGEDGQR